MSPENELLKFKVPEVEELEVILIRLENGRIVARTREEIEKMGEVEIIEEEP